MIFVSFGQAKDSIQKNDLLEKRKCAHQLN